MSTEIWNFLEVCFKAGAPPPHDISYEVVGEARDPFFQYRKWNVFKPWAAPERHRFFLGPEDTGGMTDVISDMRDYSPDKPEVFSFQDLVVDHQPSNKDILLEYANRNLAAIRGQGS